MARSVGNLAILISGNARPFNQTMNQVKQTLDRFAPKQDLINLRPPRQAGTGAEWSSFGSLARSTFLGAFGGGLAGGMAALMLNSVGKLAGGAMSVFGDAGRAAGEFLAESMGEGMKLSRMNMGLNVLSGSPERGADWLGQIRKLSAASGYSLQELGGGARTLAGSFTEMDNVLPTLRAIAEISAGIGADSQQMNRFALAVAQVTAKGRFMAQELNQL